MTSERLEVQRTIKAEAPVIFKVLSDPQGHVTIDSSGMLMDATGDPVRAVGDTFVVHMDREALNDYPMGLYDVTVTITDLVPDRQIAWTILGQMNPPIGHVYGYTLEPVEGGTVVTSYYDWSSIDPAYKDAGIFPVISETALRATLGILDRTLARGDHGTPAVPPAMSSEEEPTGEAPAPLRSPLDVISDYLNQFSSDEQGGIYDRPSAEVLIRWLRDEGWQIAPLNPAGHRESA